MSSRPGVGAAVTPRTLRVVAARRLQRRRDREETGRFLVEGPQAVREALAAGVVVELFGTGEAVARYPDLTTEVTLATEQAVAALAETVQPQGLVAVCRTLDVPLATALDRRPSLVAVLVGVRDPGNAGTVLRTADAAGAPAVVFAGDAVDPYNGKVVRASAGSLFHVDVVRTRDAVEAVGDIRTAGLRVLAADAHGETDLDAADLGEPTAWLFGSEAHGLPTDLLESADARVRVPIHGRAESLNLAAAAAVCLYSSARAQKGRRDE
jgi:TrmH family RNA methyltransferase